MNAAMHTLAVVIPTVFASISSTLQAITLRDPVWLIALFEIPVVLWMRQRRRTPVLVVPFAADWHRPSYLARSRWPTVCAVAGLALLIVALARPQRIDDRQQVKSQGYDLMLAIDLSSSMLSEDYVRDGHAINRIQAIKPVIQAFINDRPNDRIGVVAFAGHAYTLAPLTFDHQWLGKQIGRLNVGLIEDGTAIGDALGVCLSRLDQAKREVGGRRLGAFIVLLTDGGNNRGTLTPDQALAIAKARHIPIYTIGAGRQGYVPVPVGRRPDGTYIYQQMLSEVDEGLLRKLAGESGGQFYRAEDTHAIQSAFDSIDRAKKLEFQAQSQVIATELFPWFAVPGVLLMIAAAFGSRRRLPAHKPAPAARVSIPS